MEAQEDEDEEDNEEEEDHAKRCAAVTAGPAAGVVAGPASDAVATGTVTHINFWTALQASCFPSTLAPCLTEFSLSFVALYLSLFFNLLYVISVTHVHISFQSNVCLLCTFVILHHFTIYSLRSPLHVPTI